jgi:gluconate 2-dehydrogenase gamma chain
VSEHKTVEATFHDPDMENSSRRTFLRRSGAFLAASAGFAWLPLVLGEESSSEIEIYLLSQKQKKTLSAVQQHLFPRGIESPGALDINALAYLQFVISYPGFEADSRDFIVRGLQYLHEASMEKFNLVFDTLSFKQKESLLRYLADQTRWGKNWLSLLLTYIIEALLSDPVYGGNPDGIGWQWLEHQAGFPRPPANKTYNRL